MGLRWDPGDEGKLRNEVTVTVSFSSLQIDIKVEGKNQRKMKTGNEGWGCFGNFVGLWRRAAWASYGERPTLDVAVNA